MGDFIVTKQDGIYHMLLEYPYANRCEYDSDYHKSNHNIRVINTEFGKAIIGVEGSLYAIQTVNSNLHLFRKKGQHIDFNFLANSYYPALNDMLKELPFSKRKIDFRLIVITEDKCYQLYDDGFIKEDDFLVSSQVLCGITNAMLELNEDHGKNFLVKSFKTYEKLYNDRIFPALYINTKDYKVKVLGRDK